MDSAQTLTINNCETNVGRFFNIENRPCNWLNQYPLELIKTPNGSFALYLKKGSQEVRFDIDEVVLRHHKPTLV